MELSAIKRGKLIIILLIVVVLAGSSTAMANKDTGAFLRIGAGARPLGMGGAFVAIADDASATYWNPAGLAQLDRIEISSMYNDQFGLDIDYSFISYTQPLGNQTVGLSWIMLAVGDIPKVEQASEDGKPIVVGYIEDAENAILLSYGRKITEDIYAGANLKFISQFLGDDNSSGFGFDAGALYKTPIENLTLGLMLQDIASSVTWSTESEKTEDLPMLTKVGVSYKLLDDTLTLSAEVDNGPRGSEFKGGLEYWYAKTVALRLGISGENLTAGAGVRYSPSKRVSLGFDYAFLSHELGDTHRLSLGIKL